MGHILQLEHIEERGPALVFWNEVYVPVEFSDDQFRYHEPKTDAFGVNIFLFIFKGAE
jgi:hypothetical protein